MKTITKIFLGLGLSTTAAVGVGVPIIIIETNKKVAENNSKISLSKISPNSVQFSIPFSILKEVPNSNENKKAKITLKNGEKEVIVEDNFKIENDKIKFTLFNLEPETEYKLVKVEFNDKNKVEFLESNTTFKTVSNENETPKEKEPEKQTPEIDSTEGEKVLIPGEEKTENNDKIDKEDSESKKETETKPEPEPEIKEEQPDIEDEEKEQNLPGETEEKSGKGEKNKNTDDQNKSDVENNNSNQIVNKDIKSIRVGYWHLSDFSPANPDRVQLVSRVISEIKPDLILLSGMSSASGEKINSLLENLNKNDSTSSWDHITSEKGKSNQRRYTFLYKKSLLQMSVSEIWKSNQLSNDNLSQQFWSTTFNLHNGKKINFGSIIFKTPTKSKGKKRKGKKKPKTSETENQNELENQESKVKIQLDLLKKEIQEKFKSENFIFAGTIQTENNNNSGSFSEMLSSYQTLLDLSEKTKIKQGTSLVIDKPSSFLLASKDIKFNSNKAIVHNIIPILKESKAANVASSVPITIDLDLKSS